MAEPETDAQIIHPLALSSVDRELIDMQIATAKRYPRDLEKSMKRAVDAILSDPELAVDAFYEIPVAGALINGPSVRSAEIIGQHWGNMRWEDRPVSLPPEANYVEGEAFAWDVENNVASRKIKRVSIVDGYGKRYSQYRIDNAQLKAQSVAKRDAISEVVGKAYMKQMHRKAEEFLDKDFPDFEARKDSVAAYFKKIGVSADDICKYLTPKGAKVKTWDLITHKDVFRLGNVATAIKEGSITVKEVFGVEGTETSKKQAPDIQKPGETSEPDSETRAKLIADCEAAMALMEFDKRDSILNDYAKKVKEDPKDLNSWKDPSLVGLFVVLKQAAAK